jgi:ATP-dependent helicase HrpB
MLVASNGAREIAQACALLSERHVVSVREPHDPRSTSSDLLSLIDEWRCIPPHVQRAAREIEETAVRIIGRRTPSKLTDAEFRRALLAGYPDRVAQRRAAQPSRVRLASGAGAVVGPDSGVREGEFLIALDLQASLRPNDPDARIRVASRVEREWLHATGSDRVHRFDHERGIVRASRVERYGALALGEHPTAPDPEIAAQLLAEAWLEHARSEADQQLLYRLAFGGLSVDIEQVVRTAARGARSMNELQLSRALPAAARHALERDAPETIAVPSGRSIRLEYRADGSVSAQVKLQEVFGLADTPRIGPRREPLLLALLAPNGSSVEVTSDLI